MSRKIIPTHPAFPPENIASNALVVGDPKRAVEVAHLLRNPSEIWNSREYLAFTGEHNGRQISVCSHGVGASGASYIFERLFISGVCTIIRAGTCGGLLENVRAGDLIIATGAIREDGASPHIIPLEYPAIADRHVVYALERASADHGYEPCYTGLILTGALFFSYPFHPSRSEMWQKAGAIASEQELAPLLVLASIYGAKAGGIFTSDGAVTTLRETGIYNPGQEVVTRGKQAMLEIALNALAALP